MNEIHIEGFSPEEHRRRFPERWRITARNWSIFWWSLPIIPIVAGLKWLFGTEWTDATESLCVGYITAHFFFALAPVRKGLVVDWYLDKPTLWERIRNWRAS